MSKRLAIASLATKPLVIKQEAVYCIYAIKYITMVQEIWKHINNFEGLYEISNLGRVKSLERYEHHRWKKVVKKIGGRSLKPQKCNLGYLKIGLYRNNMAKIFSIHRLVAQEFLGLDISDRKMFVCHKNYIIDDNRVENLFLGTAKDNTQDAVRKGRMAIGIINGSTKLKEFQVLEIRVLKCLYNQYELSKMYKVSECCIRGILNNKTWKHI